jgi:alpha-beta hydrolase superfamily lysophospholipase
MVRDNAVLGEKLRAENPGLPFYIIGHSMGSFIARDLIAAYPDGITKVILSGTGSFQSSQVLPLKIIASLQKLFTSSGKKAALIDKLAFGGNNKQFEPGKTGFEWLSRDEEQVKLYAEDPFCGFVATAGFYLDFAEGLKRISDSSTFENTPVDLPILLYSGDHDPVGGNGEGVEKVYKQYLDTGHKRVEMKLNEGGRHESLNETNRREVYNIFAGWLDGTDNIS